MPLRMQDCDGPSTFLSFTSFRCPDIILVFSFFVSLFRTHELIINFFITNGQTLLLMSCGSLLYSKLDAKQGM